MAISNQSPLRRYLPWILGGSGALLLALAAAVALLLFLFSGKVVVTGLTLSHNRVTLGQTTTATIKLENHSRVSRKYRLILLADGKEATSLDVKLKGSEIRDIALDLPDLTLGDHVIKAEEITQQVRILTPAAFTVVSLTADPPTSILGENVKLIATVKNTGETAGTYTCNATMDGVALPTRTVQVEPGATNTVEIPIPSAAAGLHAAQIGKAATMLRVLRPTKISISDISSDRHYVPVNKDIAIQVTLQNEGDVEGIFPVIVWIDGDAQPNQNVTVKGKQTVLIPLTYRFDKAGAHKIEINGSVLTINVVAVTQPGNGTLLVKKANGGSGKLTLVNNNDTDVLFILAKEADPKTPLLMVYVRGKSTTKTIRVKDGVYIVYYSLGSDFDSASKRFITDPNYSRFDDPISYSTKYDDYYVYYSTWKITLNSGDGNSPTRAVPEDQFPK